MSGNALEKIVERRDYRRISDAIALRIEVMEEDGAANQAYIDADDLPDYPTHVVSLSPNGLKCYHTESFNEGDVVMLTMKLFPSKQCLDIEAVVVNAGEDTLSRKEDRFYGGLAFKDISLDNCNVLLAHIDTVARESFGGAVKLINK